MDLYEHWATNAPMYSTFMGPEGKIAHDRLLANFYQGPPKPTEKRNSLEMREAGLIGLYRKPWAEPSPYEQLSIDHSFRIVE